MPPFTAMTINGALIWCMLFPFVRCHQCESLELALNFSMKGWVTLRNFIPELSDSTLQSRIKSAYSLTKRNYVPYAIKNIKDRYNFDCFADAPECGRINIDDFTMEQLSEDKIEKLAHRGFEFIECCTSKSGARYLFYQNF